LIHLILPAALRPSGRLSL